MIVKSAAEYAYSLGMIDAAVLFKHLFASGTLIEAFESQFIKSPGKGLDRLNGFQFASRASVELAVASSKCLNGTYRFSPYLENLKTKGRNKYPRVIGIPTIRDRVVFSSAESLFGSSVPEERPTKCGECIRPKYCGRPVDEAARRPLGLRYGYPNVLRQHSSCKVTQSVRRED